MKCARARNLFSKYLENELDVETCVEFEQHLTECSSCKVEYGRFNVAVMMLDEMPEVDPPAGFHEGVMARIQNARNAAPKPVKWWQIDWQYVFPLRVPARAAALGVAALLFMAVLVQTTPVGTGVMNLLGLQRASTSSIGEDPVTAPSWSLRTPDVAYSMNGTGLSIGVTSKIDESMRVYDLRLQAKGNRAVKFTIEAGDRTYSGSLVRNQDSVISVPVDASKELVVARLKWNHNGENHSRYVFLPRKFDSKAHAKRLNLKFDRMTIYDILRTVSKKYGVVVLASGNLKKYVPFAEVVSGNPAEALYSGVEESGANMKQDVLGPSIYIVEPAK